MATDAALLGGRYRIGPLLGEGAVGTVSRAFDELLGRDVAIKLLKPAFAHDEVAVRRFIEEARSAARLVDQHIVGVYDVLPEAEHAIVMEYVPGGSLAQLLRERTVLSEARALAIARQIAHALAVAHARGILHRDIKPANVLLSGDVAKVADFGLAKALGAADPMLTQPGHVVGTTAYVSPEQAKGLPLTPASDLYSLGVVLHQMLTGRLPYDAASPLAAAVAHVTEPVPDLPTLSRLMRPAIASIVHRLLQKEPQARFARAADVESSLAALESADIVRNAVWDAATMTGVPIAPPPRVRRPAAPLRPILERTSAAARRSPAVTLAAGAFAAIGIVSLTAWAAHPRPFHVADVRRQSVDAAVAHLRAEGLRTATTQRPSDVAAAGTVVAQSPAAGALVKRGQVVRIVASSGPRIVVIPNLRGTTLSDARHAMHLLPLRPAFAARISAAPPNTVIEQYPAAGSTLRAGGAELIVISAGPAPPVVAVPPRWRRHHRHGGDEGD